MSGNSPFTPAHGDTVTLELPYGVFQALQTEARANRKPIDRFMAEWLEDERDARLAHRRWKRIESGQEKSIPAQEVYKRLGLA